MRIEKQDLLRLDESKLIWFTEATWNCRCTYACWVKEMTFATYNCKIQFCISILFLKTSWKSNITFFGSKEPYHVHDLLHFWNPLQYERLLFFCSGSIPPFTFLPRNVIFPTFIFTYFCRVKPILPQTNHTCNWIAVKLHSKLAFLIEWIYTHVHMLTHIAIWIHTTISMWNIHNFKKTNEP